MSHYVSGSSKLELGGLSMYYKMLSLPYISEPCHAAVSGFVSLSREGL